MAKILIIEECVRCPFSELKAWPRQMYFCKKEKGFIDLKKSSEIPSWCPLQNYPKRGLCSICSGVGVHDVEEYYKDDAPSTKERE